MTRVVQTAVVRVMLRTLTGALAWSLAVGARALAAGPTPSPTPSPSGRLGSAGSGTGYVVLAAILVAALVFSTWRLRRDR
jgi:hypothetical protein